MNDTITIDDIKFDFEGWSETDRLRLALAALATVDSRLAGSLDSIYREHDGNASGIVRELVIALEAWR